MWQLLQLIRKPSDVLLWMMSKGLGSAMEAYGVSPHDGIAAQGVMSDPLDEQDT